MADTTRFFVLRVSEYATGGDEKKVSRHNVVRGGVMPIATPVASPSRLGCAVRCTQRGHPSSLCGRKLSRLKHRARHVPARHALMASSSAPELGTLGTLDPAVVAHGVLHVHTPLLRSQPMSDLLGKEVYIKLDALQPSGSFKLRGIGYACQKAVRDGSTSLTSSSGGNAGLATAFAGNFLNVPTTVVVPTTTPEFIRKRLSSLNAKVVVFGDQWSVANERAIALNQENNGKLIHPFDDPDAWTGHATVVHEVVCDLRKLGVLGREGSSGEEEEERATSTEVGMEDEGTPLRQEIPNTTLSRDLNPAGSKKIGAFVTCVGGGGLLAGILQGLGEVGLEDTPVIAAETDGCDSMARSLQRGKCVTLPGITSVAKSLGAASPSPRVFQMCMPKYGAANKSLVRPVVVSDKDAIEACLRFADDHRILGTFAFPKSRHTVYSPWSSTLSH